MSHGSHESIREKHRIIREVEAELESPIGILADLQGPKLRVGTFARGEEELEDGRASASTSTRPRAIRQPGLPAPSRDLRRAGTRRDAAGQ